MSCTTIPSCFSLFLFFECIAHRCRCKIASSMPMALYLSLSSSCSFFLFLYFFLFKCIIDAYNGMHHRWPDWWRVLALSSSHFFFLFLFFFPFKCFIDAYYGVHHRWPIDELSLSPIILLLFPLPLLSLIGMPALNGFNRQRKERCCVLPNGLCNGKDRMLISID